MGDCIAQNDKERVFGFEKLHFQDAILYSCLLIR